MDWLVLSALFVSAQCRMLCQKTRAPLELGEWSYGLKHMDSAVVENSPRSINEGQVYVYENYFPNYNITYILVDNLAVKTCGANAFIKSGGIGNSYVLIMLHADVNQELRSVVDIWGLKTPIKEDTVNPMPNEKHLPGYYIFDKLRAVNRNKPFG